MAKSMRCRNLCRGEYVIKQGDMSRNGGKRCIHVIEKGTAVLEEHEEDRLTSPTSLKRAAGDIVGDEDFLFDSPRSCGVKVTSESMTVWSLRRDVYYEYKKTKSKAIAQLGSPHCSKSQNSWVEMLNLHMLLSRTTCTRIL